MNNNIKNNNLNQQVNIKMANADISRLASSKFTGAPEENARLWLTNLKHTPAVCNLFMIPN